MSDLGLATISLVALMLSAFYSGSETAFISADRIRLRHLAARGNRRAQRALSLIEDPEFLLSAVLVGTNLANIGCTATFTALMMRHFADSGATVATAILVPVVLIFGEILPKAVFLFYANRAALMTVGVLSALTSVMYPVVKLFSVVADVLTRALPGDARGKINVSMEELLFHIGDSGKAGLIGPETTRLVGRAIKLKQLTVSDVTTPLDSVVMLDADAPIDSYPDPIRREGYSRFPLYQGERGNVVGIMSVHEFLTSQDPSVARDQLHKPYSISLDTPIVEVLFQMREQGRHMAVVRGADNVIVGITTLEDILERLVGAISDEFN